MKTIVKCVIGIFIFCNLSLAIRQDIVGYTTYDWQLGGPISTRCRTASICNGIHVCWLNSNFNPNVDRNMGYNYYDFATRQWHWQSGMNTYTQRSGFGNLDYDPINGVVVVITAQSTGLNAARDQTPGAGIFSYCPGPANYGDPVISVSNNQAIHCAFSNVYADSLYYARIQPWCNWTTPINIGQPVPPGFHSQNIAASKISNKVAIVWQCANDPYPRRAFYRISNDGGINWQSAVQLPYPPVQGMTFTISSLFAMFDNQDNFHIVSSLSDTGVTVPAAIWHYCPVNNPQWSLIRHYAPETLVAPVGYNAIFVTRPSIVQAPNTGYFYVAWEQFDSLSYDETTYLARAEIMLAESRNNGQNWYLSNQRRITQHNTTSKRFPCIGGVFNDTIVISYMIDSIAGFSVMSQGRTTRNPIVCHFYHVQMLQSPMQEQSMIEFINPMFHASPNPFNSQIAIHYSLPANTKALLEIFDVTGRLVKSLKAVSGSRSAVGNFVWNGKDNNGKAVQPGIYFCTLKTRDKTLTQKIVKTR